MRTREDAPNPRPVTLGGVFSEWMLALRGVATLVSLGLSQIMTLDLLARAVSMTLMAVTVQTKQ